MIVDEGGRQVALWGSSTDSISKCFGTLVGCLMALIAAAVSRAA